MPFPQTRPTRALLSPVRQPQYRARSGARSAARCLVMLVFEALCVHLHITPLPGSQPTDQECPGFRGHTIPSVDPLAHCRSSLPLSASMRHHHPLWRGVVDALTPVNQRIPSRSLRLEVCMLLLSTTGFRYTPGFRAPIKGPRGLA
jgi:hypothetical protein